MLNTLLTFVLSLLGWSGLLWFGIKPNFLKISTPLLLLLHLLPPLTLALVAWIRHRKEKYREQNEAKEKEETERKQREAAHAAAQAKHQQEMRWRRQGCDCRAVAVAGLFSHQAGAAPELDNVEWQTLEEEDETLSQRPIDPLSALLPHLRQALETLYVQSPAALHFPIYLLPPSSVPGEELISQVRDIVQDLARQQLEHAPAPVVTYLPGADNTAQRLIGLFDQQPELPGFVALGFDSPLALLEPEDPEDGPSKEQAEARRIYGQAGQAVVALLLTHPELNPMLTALEQHELDPSAEPLLPHWERAELGQIENRQLAAVALELRESLAELPVLARIHRGVSQQFSGSGPKAMELAKHLRTLLEQALINAGALVHPFDKTADTEAELPNCAWLVHNVGSPIGSGARLSAISAALHAFEVDLNPIAEATNTVVRFGDVGAARPLLMAALAAIHAAQTQSAALCTEFSGPDEVSLYLAQPLIPT